MGFFLQDLHQRIADMHTQQSETRDNNKCIAYRGQVLTSDNDEQLKKLTDYMRKELGEGTSLSKLDHLMLKMGEFNQAEEIYAPQLDSTDEKNWQKHAHLNNQLGYIYRQKGDYKAALSYYQKALEIRQKTLPSNHPGFGTIYSNSGGLHQDMRD
ncbi:unnamed protein product [Rotaria sp. Silwood2]|nr:unnamed protein product [Rotaria sp. Silwood2]CAF3332319.1 unnamed protein product [Rotaria sp. Silwood2]CAF4137388.1 unnamed protein product [Rotaria sp. Silwood2]CAF4531239.1 unnamed protein product [Rotaria sp. Silwood2]